MQVRSALPHPATRRPGKVQMIDLVSGAYCAELDCGTAVTVALAPAATICDGEASSPPHMG